MVEMEDAMDSREFRMILGHFSVGVAVATRVEKHQGQPVSLVGLTDNSVASPACIVLP